MKKFILTPNPYRDKGFRTVLEAQKILNEAGIETRICLPFDVDKTYELPKDIRFSRLDREIQRSDAVICFGGDGTILHMAKAATRHRLPVLPWGFRPAGYRWDPGNGHRLPSTHRHPDRHRVPAAAHHGAASQSSDQRSDR